VWCETALFCSLFVNSHSILLQLSKESSSYQILKATLAFIANEDWTAKGVFMNPFDFEVPGFPESESRPSQEVWRERNA
jgi:hypothetical protein